MAWQSVVPCSLSSSALCVFRSLQFLTGIVAYQQWCISQLLCASMWCVHGVAGVSAFQAICLHGRHTCCPLPLPVSIVLALGALLPICLSTSGGLLGHCANSIHFWQSPRACELKTALVPGVNHSLCSCYGLLLSHPVLSNDKGIRPPPGDRTAPTLDCLCGPTVAPLLTLPFPLHCSDDGDSRTQLPLLVTASVDAIKLRTRLDLSKDMHMSGAVVWTGEPRLPSLPSAELKCLLAGAGQQRSLDTEAAVGREQLWDLGPSDSLRSINCLILCKPFL